MGLLSHEVYVYLILLNNDKLFADDLYSFIFLWRI